MKVLYMTLCHGHQHMLAMEQTQNINTQTHAVHITHILQRTVNTHRVGINCMTAQDPSQWTHDNLPNVSWRCVCEVLTVLITRAFLYVQCVQCVCTCVQCVQCVCTVCPSQHASHGTHYQAHYFMLYMNTANYIANTA